MTSIIPNYNWLMRQEYFSYDNFYKNESKKENRRNR